MSLKRFAVVARPSRGVSEMIVEVFETREQAREYMDAKTDKFPKWDFSIEDMEVNP